MTVYIISHCNEWQEYSSFRLIGVVGEDKLENALQHIKEELDYNDEEMETYIYCEQVELNDLSI